MQDMLEGLQAIAQAMRDNTSALAQPIKEDAQSTLQGQAQAKVQQEKCLTPAGVLVLMDVLADPTMARTYLILLSNEVREEWIKNLLFAYGELHTVVIWDWFNGKGALAY